MINRVKSSRKILLLGGAGYIGTSVAYHLLKEGYKIKSVDNFLYGNNRCPLFCFFDENFEFVYGDFSNKNFINSVIGDITDVIILGALVGDPITKKYPKEAEHINIQGIKNVLQCLDGKDIDRVIFASTCSNYGIVEGNELADETCELKPQSLYARTKVELEKYLLSLRGKIDYCPTILRFSTAFGISPRMRFDLTVNEFAYEMYINKELLVFDKDTWRPYCHVRDFARAVRLVLEAPRDLVDFEVFNVGGEHNNCTKQMIVEIGQQLVPRVNIVYKDNDSDPRNYRVNFKKIKDTLNFEPKYTVVDGMKEIIYALGNKFFNDVREHKDDYGCYKIFYNVPDE